jgi:hypothetical protein
MNRFTIFPVGAMMNLPRVAAVAGSDVQHRGPILWIELQHIHKTLQGLEIIPHRITRTPYWQTYPEKPVCLRFAAPRWFPKMGILDEFCYPKSFASSLAS